MLIRNINSFIIISLVSAVVSILFGFNFLITKPYRKTSIPFAIFSFLVFLVSLSALIMLFIENYVIAVFWSKVLFFGVLLTPIAQLIVILNYIENKFSKIKEFYKYLLYIIPLAIYLPSLMSNNIGITESSYGYIMDQPQMKFIAPFYIITINLILIVILIFEINKSQKSNKSYNGLVLLLSGFIIYIIGQALYQSLRMVNLVISVPSNSMSIIILYIFMLISILSIQAGVHNLTLAQAFRDVHDCILVASGSGEILEINDCMKKMLFNEDNLINKREYSSEQIKKSISNLMSDNMESNTFFAAIQGSSIEKYNKDLAFNVNGGTQTYNVSVSPILDKNKKIIGKLGIFRDITDRKIIEESLEKSQKELEIRNKEIEYLSYHDSLTGLYNRRYFEEELMRLDTSRQIPISIIVADVDRLKYVNDRFGHNAGDRLIIAATKIIINSCRKEDIIARWGGDEFIILLPNTSEEKAGEVVDRIRKAYDTKRMDDKISISISLGLSTKNNSHEKIDDIIGQADKNMYDDKARLKNDTEIGKL